MTRAEDIKILRDFIDDADEAALYIANARGALERLIASPQQGDRRSDNPVGPSVHPLLSEAGRDALAALISISEDERAEVLSSFCGACHRLMNGPEDRCHCWNDE